MVIFVHFKGKRTAWGAKHEGDGENNFLIKCKITKFYNSLTKIFKKKMSKQQEKDRRRGLVVSQVWDEELARVFLKNKKN